MKRLAVGGCGGITIAFELQQSLVVLKSGKVLWAKRKV
jgi:hypothetical protein